jgi:chromate reductase
MSANYNIAVFVGSLRKESLNRKMARALVEAAPSGMTLEIIEIGDLALYTEDAEKEAPESWRKFRERVRPADAVLFVTPEYNRSVPGCLKNAIDVGSRPYGKSVWMGKPGAVVSVSPSPIGAFGANHHLRQSMVFLNVPMLQQPEAYIGGAADMFDAQGKLTRENTKELLSKFLQAFATWIARNSATAAKSG